MRAAVVGSRGLNGTYDEALGLLASGLVSWEPLITDRFGLDDLQSAMEGLRRGEGIKTVTVSAGGEYR